jgi:hypothetical protein
MAQKIKEPQKVKRGKVVHFVFERERQICFFGSVE